MHPEAGWYGESGGGGFIESSFIAMNKVDAGRDAGREGERRRSHGRRHLARDLRAVGG